MTLAVLILCGLIALELLVLLLTQNAPARTPGPSLVGRTVVVHTRQPDDQSVRGVLVGQHADRLVLREAVYLHGESSVEAAGLVHLPTMVVSTVQEIEPPTETG